MGPEKEVNMSSTLRIPLHKEVDLQLWVRTQRRRNPAHRISPGAREFTEEKP